MNRAEAKVIIETVKHEQSVNRAEVKVIIETVKHEQSVNRAEAKVGLFKQSSMNSQ